MRYTTLVTGAGVLMAGSVASAAFVDMKVQTGIWIGNRDAPNFATLVDDFVNTHMETDATTTGDGVPRTTVLPGLLGAATPNVNFTITVTQLNATTRQIDLEWVTVNGAPFVAEGTMAGNNTTPTDLIWTWGMGEGGAFPGPATDIFDDPALIQVISNTGTIFDDSGSTLASDAALELAPNPADDDGLYGRLFFQRRSGGQPNLNDILERRAARYVAQIVYEVPAPGAMALLGMSGLAVARRRR